MSTDQATPSRTSPDVAEYNKSVLDFLNDAGMTHINGLAIPDTRNLTLRQTELALDLVRTVVEKSQLWERVGLGRRPQHDEGSERSVECRSVECRKVEAGYC